VTCALNTGSTPFRCGSFRRLRVEQELDEELSDHLDRTIEENLA
jgi:hypothetical protein